MRIPLNEEDVGYVYEYLGYRFVEGKNRKYLLGVFSLNKYNSDTKYIKMTYREFKESYPIRTALNHHRHAGYKRPKNKIKHE